MITNNPDTSPSDSAPHPNKKAIQTWEICCGIIWFLFLSTIFYLNFILGYFNLFDNIIISNTSSTLSLFVFIILPLIVLFSPFLIALACKKTLLKSFSVSVIIVIVYFIIVFILNMSLICYFQVFTKNKWVKYPDNRFLMIESLENQYNLIGMPKEEILTLLGEPGDLGRKTNGEFEYFIKSGSLLEYEVYIIVFQNDVAIKTRRTKRD
ncbi:MAG: hypothetical protein FWD67_09645 [Betaproteobacteria bacterium]|nr:hypothetical protein [Betaproteobacteria bacterium]